MLKLKDINKLRDMKQTIKLNESQLKKIVAESVKRVLKEDLRTVLDWPNSWKGSADHIIHLAYESCYEIFDAYHTFVNTRVQPGEIQDETLSYTNPYAIVKDIYNDFTKIARKIDEYNAEAEEAGEVGENGEITSNYFGLQDHH